MLTRTDRVPGAPRIAYEHAGTGPGVVFLHGIGGHRGNWTAQLLAAAPQFHAVAWDARGYGLSDDARGDWRFSDFSADLRRLLDHLGWDRANVVGLSMGGRIAQDFYARHADRVHTLCLCSSFPADHRMAPDRRAEFLRARQQPLLEGRTPRDIAPSVARSLLGRAASPQAYAHLVESISALRAPAYLKTLEVVAHHSGEDPLGSVGVPTLLIFGGDDALTPPELGRRMHAAIPGSQLAVIPGAGHLTNVEQPEEFNRLLLEFLRSAALRARRKTGDG